VRILPILQKAEWGEVVAVPAKPPPDTVLDSISAPSQPPVWAAFFMAMISAVARLFRRA
jgi:hypothetical protein